MRYRSSDRIKNKKSRSSSSTITRLCTRRKSRKWANKVDGVTESRNGVALVVVVVVVVVMEVERKIWVSCAFLREIK